MNRRRNKWIERHWILLTAMGLGLCVLVGWVDYKINPSTHTQTWSQGWHQLFH